MLDMAFIHEKTRIQKTAPPCDEIKTLKIITTIVSLMERVVVVKETIL